MPKVSHSHAQARQKQILDAACRCFARRGVHRTTMRDICREAGLSAGAIYGYFPGKADLVEAIARAGRENTRAFIDAVERPPDPPQGLARLAETLVATLGDARDQGSLRLDVRMWGEALDAPRIRELFVQALGSAIEPFEAIVREGQARRRIDGGLAPDSVARVMVAMFLGLQVQQVMDPELDLAPCARAAASLLDGSFAVTRGDAP